MIAEASGSQTIKVDQRASEWASAVKEAQLRAMNAINSAFQYSKNRWDKSHVEISYAEGDLVRRSSKFFDFAGTQTKLKPA